MSLSKRKEYRSPWGVGWQSPRHIGIVLKLGTVQWPLPALGSSLGLNPSLRQEGGPNSGGGACSGVRAWPHLCEGGLSPVMSQSIASFSPPILKTNKKREFLNLWSTQKGEAPAEGALGTVPARRGARCLRGSFCLIPAPYWGATVPGDMGPALLLLLTAASIWHGRSTGPPKPYSVSMSLRGRFGLRRGFPGCPV